MFTQTSPNLNPNQVLVLEVHVTGQNVTIIEYVTREWTIIGSVSYRNRYWVDRIESYRLLLYRPILRASLQVHQLLTVTLHMMTKGRSSDPSPAHHAHTRACCFMVHDMGKGWRGGRPKETVT